MSIRTAPERHADIRDLEGTHRVFNLGTEAEGAAFSDITGLAIEQVFEHFGGTIHAAAQELVEHHHPALKNDTTGDKQDKIDQHLAQGEGFGRAVVYTDNGDVQWVPEEDDFWALLTDRRQGIREPKELVTARRDTAAAFIGNSVGSNIFYEFVKEGVGKRLVTVDPDRIDPTNLGRIHASWQDVGKLKVEHFAHLAARINPYVEVIQYADHATEGNLDKILSHLNLPHNFVFEETDDLPTKILTREYARRYGITTMMVTDAGDNEGFEVERFDLDQSLPLFGGRVDETILQKIVTGEISKTDDAYFGALVAIAGGEAALPEAFLNGLALAANGELAGIPQLGAIARRGAAGAVETVQAVIFGEDVPSGPKVATPLYYPTMHAEAMGRQTP